MPGIIYTGTKSSKKQPKKPGWKQREEEYAEWLKKHQPDQAKIAKAKAALKSLTSRQATASGQTAVSNSSRSALSPSRSTFTPAFDLLNKVNDPRILYKDSPEMLERELKARERKFTTAPVYNKGGDVLITDEMMKDIMAGTTRRRG